MKVHICSVGRSEMKDCEQPLLSNTNKINIWVNRGFPKTPWEVLEYLPNGETAKYLTKNLKIMCPSWGLNKGEENLWMIETIGKIEVCGELLTIS